MLWISIDVLNFSIYHIFNFRLTQKFQHCRLCVLRENSFAPRTYYAETSDVEFRLVRLDKAPEVGHIDMREESIRYDQWRIQDFPEEGAPGGGAIYYFTNFLHENKEILVQRGGGVASLAPPLDPPLMMVIIWQTDWLKILDRLVEVFLDEFINLSHVQHEMSGLLATQNRNIEKSCWHVPEPR